MGATTAQADASGNFTIANVPLAVVMLCAVGASGMIWTYRPAVRATADATPVTDNPLIDPPTLS